LRRHSLPWRSSTSEDYQVESGEHQDNPNIRYQPFPESVSEKYEVYTHYDGCHRRHVNHNSYMSVHLSTTSFLAWRHHASDERPPYGGLLMDAGLTLDGSPRGWRCTTLVRLRNHEPVGGLLLDRERALSRASVREFAGVS
jgi:hypothetical protein